MAVLFVEIVVMSTYLALLTRFFNDEDLALRLTVFPITAPFVAIPVAYLCGFLLNRYYNTYRDFCDEKASTNDKSEQMRYQEKFEKSNF